MDIGSLMCWLYSKLLGDKSNTFIQLYEVDKRNAFIATLANIKSVIMKYLTITIFLLSNFTSLIGQPCKWKENKTDEFTDSKYLKSTTISIAGDQKFGNSKRFARLSLELKDNKVIISIDYSEDILLTDNEISNPILSIKLKNTDIIKLRSNESFAPHISSLGTSIQFYFELPKEELRKFADENFIGLRLKINADEHSFIPADKKKARIRELFKCMLKEI